MHKDIQTLEKETESLHRGTYFLCMDAASSPRATQFPFLSGTKCTNVKGRQIKINTSNMRSHNKIIQVRCVEIKLKVNNSNNKNNSKHQQQQRQQQQGTSETWHRDKTTQRKRGLIYSIVLLVAPLSCETVSHPISDFVFSPPPPILSLFYRPFCFQACERRPRKRKRRR